MMIWVGCLGLWLRFCVVVLVVISFVWFVFLRRFCGFAWYLSGCRLLCFVLLLGTLLIAYLLLMVVLFGYLCCVYDLGCFCVWLLLVAWVTVDFAYGFCWVSSFCWVLLYTYGMSWLLKPVWFDCFYRLFVVGDCLDCFGYLATCSAWLRDWILCFSLGYVAFGGFATFGARALGWGGQWF